MSTIADRSKPSPDSVNESMGPCDGVDSEQWRSTDDGTEEDARGVAKWRASTTLEIPTIPTGNVRPVLNYASTWEDCCRATSIKDVAAMNKLANGSKERRGDAGECLSVLKQSGSSIQLQYESREGGVRVIWGTGVRTLDYRPRGWVCCGSTRLL